MDIIYNRTRDLIATSGDSALMSITDKPSIASVKSAQLLQAAKGEYLMKQFENFMNTVINEYFDLKYTWKVNIWGDVFNWRTDASLYKEMYLAGAKGVLPKLLSAYDISIEDYIVTENYVDAYGIKIQSEALQEQIKQNRVALTQASNASTGKVGRPRVDEDKIENDNTGISVDAGNNVSEIKSSETTRVNEVISSTSYSANNINEVEDNFNDNLNSNLNNNYNNTNGIIIYNQDFTKKNNKEEFSVNRCVVCGAELDEENDRICDECLEQLYNERIGK